ncbi:hypothetical protein LZC95_23705 [Pendulispora brunnea]|uniref:Uncharacterized protein n=1 Tax=Pendulispora brunnea TaxID=2905690 RepID=A0ABZ2KMC3_9BACT
MDPQTHKRYLDYRQRYEYFGRQKAILTAVQFSAFDAELRALQGKGGERDAREDEDEARLVELRAILLLD